MTIKNRLAKLEQVYNPPQEEKIYVAIYDPITRLVKSGAPELIGMTEAEVRAYTKSDTALHVQTASMQDETNIIYIPDNGRD